MEVEEPEIVTVRIESEDGSDPIDIKFTRAEYDSIAKSATATRVSVTEWIIEAIRRGVVRPTRTADARGTA